MTSGIRAEGLRKGFGVTQALAGVDLDVAAGTVLGLLGRNGAGKTTTVRVLATLLRPDSGRATIAGVDILRHPARARSMIGVTGQYSALDGRMTARENLVMIGRLYHLTGREARRRAAELLERFRLTGPADRAARTFSGGMLRRLDLAASIMNRAPVLFLDEPTTGLDPGSRLDLWRVVEELVADGTTVLLTTQYLDEVDRLAHRIAVMDRGRVVAEGTADELKRRLRGEVVAVQVANPCDLPTLRAVLADHGTPVIDEAAAGASVSTSDGVRVLAAVAGRLSVSGIGLVHLGLRHPSLDEVFLALTEDTQSGPGESRARLRAPARSWLPSRVRPAAGLRR